MSDLSLESTSQFSRPVWATEKDMKVGEDELGNSVFLGSGGRTYVVKPNPEQPSRPEGGYVRAALGAIKDIPPVADWDFERIGPGAAKGAQAIADALWGVVDTPRAILAGEKTPTIGDAVDVAGFSATGGLAASVPQGALAANIPMFKSRATQPKSEMSDTPPKIDPFDEPINWSEFGGEAPSEFEGLTFRQWNEFIESDELPIEFLQRNNIEPSWQNEYFMISQIDNSQLQNTTMGRFFSEGIDDDLFIRGDGIRSNTEPYAEFRSPVKEVLDDLEIPSKGLKGSQFLKELKDNPTIRNSEVSALDLQIDPMKRYTREELSALVDENIFTTQALGAGPRYRSMQRQPVLDPETDYEEIIVNASRKDGKPMFQPKHGATHYNDNTIAHARVSVRQPDMQEVNTRPYLLVEEMQSDLLQHGYSSNKPVSWKDAVQTVEPWGEIAPAIKKLPYVKNYQETFKSTISQLRDKKSIATMDASEVRQFLKESGVEDSRTLFNPFLDFTQATGVPVGRKFSRQVDEYFSDDSPLELDPEFIGKVTNFNTFLLENYGIDSANWFNLNSSQSPKFFEWVIKETNKKPSELEHSFLEGFQSILWELDKKPRAVVAPPITSTTESTRTLVQSLLAYADQKGVGEIVFPPLERIAAQRFTPGTEQYEKAIKPGSGFYSTYVTSLQKVLKELQSELGENAVTISERPIRYEASASDRFGLNSEILPEEDLMAYRQFAEEDGVSIREVMPEELLRQMDRENGKGWEKSIISIPSTGISIQIPIGSEIDFSKPRFYKGGLVVDYTKQALGEVK